MPSPTKARSSPRSHANCAAPQRSPRPVSQASEPWPTDRRYEIEFARRDRSAGKRIDELALPHRAIAASYDRPSAVKLTQRTIPEVTFGGSTSYVPSSSRTTLPAPPGGKENSRMHSASDATYSRLIQYASSAAPAENAGSATTSRIGLMREGARPAAPGAFSASERATTYPTSTRRPNGTRTARPIGRPARKLAGGTPYANGSDSARDGMSDHQET